MGKIESQCFRPDLKQHENGLAYPLTEKLSIFEAGISGGECSLVPFGADYLQVRPESYEKSEFSLYFIDFKDSMAEGESYNLHCN